MTTNDLDLYSITETLAKHGFIAIFWHTEDVLMERDDLTEEQALEVLQECKDNHDACFGVTYETIRTVAGERFPKGGDTPAA